MTNPTSERGYFKVAARQEDTRESPGASVFEVIERIGGSLDDAKLCAQSYFNRRTAPPHSALEWVEGDPVNDAPCYYANTRFITFRISR
jgi:hypothetical protein